MLLMWLGVATDAVGRLRGRVLLFVLRFCCGVVPQVFVVCGWYAGFLVSCVGFVLGSGCMPGFGGLTVRSGCYLWLLF